MRMLPKRGSVINNAWLVRVLANGRNAHHCTSCGARMFVKGPSGLCPVCFTANRQLERSIESVVEEARSAVPEPGAER